MNSLGSFFSQFGRGSEPWTAIQAFIGVIGTLGLIFSVIMAVLGFGSSGTQNPPTPDPTPSGLVINPLARAVDEAEGTELFVGTNTSGDPSPYGTLQVPTTAVENGDIVVGSVLSVPPMAGLPEGALVKVTVVDEGASTTLLQTEQATITDVTEQTDGYMEFEPEVTLFNVTPESGVEVSDSNVNFFADLDGQNLLKKELQTSVAVDGFDLSVVAQFSMGAALGFNVGPSGLTEFKLELIPHTTLAVDANTASAALIDYSMRLATYQGAIKFMIGTVPVWVTTNGSIDFEANGSVDGPISYSPTYTVSQATGFLYKEGSFTQILDEAAVAFSGFEELDLAAPGEFRTSLTPGVTANFYNLAEISGQVNTWTLLVGTMENFTFQCYLSGGANPDFSVVVDADLAGIAWDQRTWFDILELWNIPGPCPADIPDPGVDPTPDLAGAGVVLEGGQATGGSEQWGHVEGFFEDKPAWVLSTGILAQATGDPSFFASTSMGYPGSPELSLLAGGETYDAATYRVTAIPTGTTLFIEYAFASEEYPEYVGSQYNDVMAIFVNGENCALVPETGEAVSINNVNHLVNIQYYVDNTFGAIGYSTSFDGLTKNLRCAVPVVPGQPVDILIAVADTGDPVYDSAVALVDGGIYSQ